MTNLQKKAIVTGAAGGLGRAFALRLACDGWCLAICDRNVAGCEETLSLVRAAKGGRRVESLDVGDPGRYESLRQRLESDWQHLDLLINNAGVTAIGEVGQLPLDQWHRLLRVNLLGVIYGCHTFVNWLKRNPDGSHIINVSSTARP